MEPKDWISIAGIFAAALVSSISILMSHRNLRQQLEREDRIREQERLGVPHVEFSVDCNTFGPEDDSYLVEFLLTACNRGHIQQKFLSITLRVRGITGSQGLSYWEGYEPRLSFPDEIVDEASVIPKGYNYFFVEPGVVQVFTYVTKIPSSYKYILAHARFEYDKHTPHTTERVFRLRPSQ